MTDVLPPKSGPWAAVLAWWRVPANQLLVLLLVLAAVPLLWQLGAAPIQLWDESRLATSSLEMSRGGNLLVPTYGGQPDHWSMKPPLLIWWQALSFRVLGYTPWALRLPSALAALATVWVLFRFATRQLGRPLAGFFAGLVLVSTVGYVRLHGTRTGDYDAALALWETLVWAGLFSYLETGRPRAIYGTGAALAAAVLTKGVAGLLGGPALLLYVLLRGRLGWLLRQRPFYLTGAAVLAVLAAYYLGREAIDPGYLALVRDNELGGRFNQSLDGHVGPWSYYFDNMYAGDFSAWLWWLLPAGLAWLQPDRRLRHAVVLLLLFALGWLLVISSSVTKLEWYSIPAYPALALLIGLGLDLLYHDVMRLYLPRMPGWAAWPWRVALVLLVFYFPYRHIVRYNNDVAHGDIEMDADAHLVRYLDQTLRERTNLDSVTLVYQDDFDSAVEYVRTAANLQPGTRVRIRHVGEVPLLQAGTAVLVCDPAYRARLEASYRLVSLHNDYPCETLLLVKK